MPDAVPNLMTVFAEALERTDPAARAAYLDGACGEDAPLRRRVDALLAAHDGAGRFLEGEPNEMSEPTLPATMELSEPSQTVSTLGPSKTIEREHGWRRCS